MLYPVKCQYMLCASGVTKRKYESLLVLIMYVHKYVRSARVFTNQLLEALRDCEDKNLSKVPQKSRKTLLGFRVYATIEWHHQICS